MKNSIEEKVAELVAENKDIFLNFEISEQGGLLRLRFGYNREVLGKKVIRELTSYL